MENTEVALALIALTATSIGGIIWLAKYFAKELSADLRAHTEAAVTQTEALKRLQRTTERQVAASDKHAEIQHETLSFMKNLNGKLEGAVISKADENKKKANKFHVQREGA